MVRTMEGDPPILLFTTLQSCDKCVGVLSSACHRQLLVGMSKMFCMYYGYLHGQTVTSREFQI